MSTALNQTTFSLADAGAKLAAELLALKSRQHLTDAQAHPYRLEVEIADLDFLSWLNHQDSAVKIFWENRSKDFMIAGIGAADLLSVETGEEDYEIISRIEKKLSLDFSNLQYFGGFCFNPHYPPTQQWKNWRSGRFILPLIEIRKTKDTTTLACNIFMDENFNQTAQEARQKLLGLAEPNNSNNFSLLPPYSRQNIPDEQTWKKYVADIIQSITQNKFEKVVLARCVQLDFHNSVNPFHLMSRLRQTASN